MYENLQYYRLRLYDVLMLLRRQLENEQFYATRTPIQPRPAAAQGSPSSVPTRRPFVPPPSVRPDAAVAAQPGHQPCDCPMPTSHVRRTEIMVGEKRKK